LGRGQTFGSPCEGSDSRIRRAIRGHTWPI
jgi:hypothetical protein